MYLELLRELLWNIFIMILIAFMWGRTPSGPDHFKRVIKYQTLRSSFYGGFESAANITLNGSPPKFSLKINFGWRSIQSYQTVAIIKGN